MFFKHTLDTDFFASFMEFIDNYVKHREPYGVPSILDDVCVTDHLASSVDGVSAATRAAKSAKISHLTIFPEKGVGRSISRSACGSHHLAGVVDRSSEREATTKRAESSDSVGCW